MRKDGETKLPLPTPGAAVLEIGVTNAEHFAAFIQQGGYAERYGEWLKARFDFCERIRTIVTDRKGRHKVISHIDNISQETDSSQTGTAANAENGQEASDPYEDYYSEEAD